MDGKNQNEFTFSLYQGNLTFKNGGDGSSETTFNEEVLLCEKVFDADVFNPFTRYSIDIRNILPHSISRLQKTLSRKNYDVVASVGNGVDYDMKEYHTKMVKTYPKELRNGMWYNPKSQKQEIDNDKIIKGVPCRIGLYINGNPIVERIFYVDNFNPIARFSLDIVDTVVSIVDIISDQIKGVDIKNMWDDYDLIDKGGLNINQIRELSPGKRAYLLRTIN